MSIISRQNTQEAIKFHKASLYCFKKEHKLRYIIIIVSMSLCVLGIFLNYLKDFTTTVLHGLRLDAYLTLTVISYASGFFLIIQMFLNIIAWRMHIEGVNIREKFDLSVYGMKANEVMMRPIQDALIDHYSTKIKRPDIDYFNQYWANDTELINEKKLIFENQKKLFYNDYQLMIFVKQRYFNFLWVGFFIMILAFSVINATDTFQSVLNGIFFPSLSAISMIVASWKNYNETFMYLHNVLNCLSRYENEKPEDLGASLTLRNIQDAMFTHRANGFIIPFFMVSHYERWKSKNERLRLSKTNKKIQSIERKQRKSAKTQQSAPSKNEPKKVRGISILEKDNLSKESPNSVAVTSSRLPAEKAQNLPSNQGTQRLSFGKAESRPANAEKVSLSDKLRALKSKILPEQKAEEKDESKEVKKEQSRKDTKQTVDATDTASKAKANANEQKNETRQKDDKESKNAVSKNSKSENKPSDSKQSDIKSKKTVNNSKSKASVTSAQAKTDQEAKKSRK